MKGTNLSKLTGDKMKMIKSGLTKEQKISRFATEKTKTEIRKLLEDFNKSIE